MRVAFVALNCGGTMGLMAIVSRAADRLRRNCSASCMVVSDFDFRPFGPPSLREHTFMCIPEGAHQLSVGGCIASAPVAPILAWLKEFKCEQVVFSTFFSGDLVRAVNEAGMRSVLLTFPLRDSHWEAFHLRGYGELFSDVIVFADLYDPACDLPNQTRVAPLYSEDSLSCSLCSASKKVLVLCGGGGRPSSQQMYDLVASARLELLEQGITLDWALSHGAKSRLSCQMECNGFRGVDWKPDLISWIHEYDSVISEAGFNTVTELVLSSRPALLVPGHRRIDNQELRAVNYEHCGCGVCCFPEEGPTCLADRIRFCLLDDEWQKAARQRCVDKALALKKWPSLEDALS